MAQSFEFPALGRENTAEKQECAKSEAAFHNLIKANSRRFAGNLEAAKLLLKVMLVQLPLIQELHALSEYRLLARLG
jgi:hypothetical protein